jgi:hypothetical protein
MSQRGTSGNRKPKPFLDREKSEADDFRKRIREVRRNRGEPSPLRPIKVAPKKNRKVHLIIGDSHAHHEEPNNRFESLGRMVKSLKPDCVIDIGDSADMSSLRGFEVGSHEPIFEGHSYWRDIDVYRDARDRFHHYLKGGSSKPRLVKLTGNHEDRIDRVLKVEPRFRGIISIADLGDEEDYGWEVIPFLSPHSIDSVVYSHYFKARGSSRPVAGIVPTRAVIMKYPGSQTKVFGHTHSFGFFEQADGSPENPLNKISVLNAGCYFDLNMSGMDWSGTDIGGWRSGILLIEVEGGQLQGWKWFDYWDIQREWGV